LPVVLQFDAGGGILQPYTIEVHAGDAPADVPGFSTSTRYCVLPRRQVNA